MKKIFTILLLTFFTSAYAGGHITKAQKEQTIQCLGCLLYTSDAADE